MGQTILKIQMIEKGIPVYSATIEDKPLGFIDKNQNKINLSFGDFVIPARGASIGFVTLITCENACCTQTTMYMKLFNNIVSNYLYFVFYGLKDLIFKVSGSAQPQITVGDVSEQLFPLPPINEQKRIEKKIDILKRYLNTYHKIEKELTSLESSFEEKLKASILQYAIEGKLVKQDPNDEPASVLLERIKMEKEKLIREGKIKRDKNDSDVVVGDDKNYYEKINNKTTILNDSFLINLSNYSVIQRFKNVLDVRDGTHDSPHYFENGYPFITSKNLVSGKIDYTNIKYISKEDFDSYNVRSNAEKDDILFGMIGTIGNPVIIENPPFKFAFKNMALIKVTKSLYSVRFIFYYLKYLESKFIKESSGAVQKFISLNYIRETLIPVPTLSYQNSVVNIIDSIFYALL